MSQKLIDHNPDLKRLRDEGYEVEIRSGHLLVHGVPYLNADKSVMAGTLISTLALAGDQTIKPDTHVVYFAGDYPCQADGSPIRQIGHQSRSMSLAEGLVAHHSFSSKPKGGYTDYHHKMATYAAIISGPAQSVDSTATAKSFKVVEAKDEESVFNYVDTSSSRAGIVHMSDRLRAGRIGIVGLGGTGSYVLDLIAKTPVPEIHLYDGDKLLQHNAFRSPGAPSVAELQQAPSKVAYFAQLYSKMHRRIVPHEGYIDASSVDQLGEMGFVFLCVDKPSRKRPIVEKLEQWGALVNSCVNVFHQAAALSSCLGWLWA